MISNILALTISLPIQNSKFYDSGTWIGVVGDITWNEAKTSTTFVIGDGGNVKIEAAGYYRVGADTKKMVATLDKTGWEIIGECYSWWDGIKAL